MARNKNLELELSKTKEKVEHLISELELRDRMIAEETLQKYEAYKRIAALQSEINTLKEK